MASSCKSVSCRVGLTLLACVAILLTTDGECAAGPSAAPGDSTPQRQTDSAGTVIDRQPYRQTSSNSVTFDERAKGITTLVNLNPTVNSWYLLEVIRPDGSKFAYHLENSRPRSQRLVLDSRYPAGIDILEGDVHHPCPLLGTAHESALEEARKSRLPYAPLCEGRLLLRNPVRGARTTLEAEVDFVRGRLWGGEMVITSFHHLLEDSHRQTAAIYTPEEDRHAVLMARDATAEAPLRALIDPKYANRLVSPKGLAIALERDRAGLTPGEWYPARGNPGVFVSVIEPQWIDTAILESHSARVNALDAIEASSLCYLVAFDLDRFELGYALGTEHPSVGWSEHIQRALIEPGRPGPDGIGSIAPLVATGMVSPVVADRTVATFTGGFKRAHGAFKYGELARKNRGSHYGFVEQGIVLSQLQPALATILVLEAS